MLSRRYKVAEKKAARRGVFFMFLSILLLGGFFIFGLPLLANFVGLVDTFKKSSTPVQADDTTPPPPPQLNSQPPSATQENRFTFIGRAESGSTLSIFKNQVKSKEMLVDDSGIFSYEATLSEGENRFHFVSTDPAGNTSESSPVYLIILDAQSPSLEVSKPQDGQTFYSLDKNVTVEGTTERDAQVTINDRLAVVGLEGSFSQKIKLSEGENTLLIIAVDKAGNKTEKSVKVTYAP